MNCLKTVLGSTLLGALVVAAGVASASPIEGRWAGDRMQLVIGPDGGRISADCASGSFAGAVLPDAAGHFVALGSFDQHQPGAQQADGVAAPVKARFAGDLKDGVLRLTISPEGGEAPQIFNLRKDARMKVVRCL